MDTLALRQIYQHCENMLEDLGCMRPRARLYTSGRHYTVLRARKQLYKALRGLNDAITALDDIPSEPQPVVKEDSDAEEK